ncbi:MAG: DUF2142 domain-containing protein [Desulfobacteraceae bacterium]|nr:MAG: DUF2142 domain-containing protein [Desulfobacteraceae bacterium]
MYTKNKTEKEPFNKTPTCLDRMLQPESVFLVMALIAGLYMVFITGPFQAPDENTHFFRAYQISEGKIFSERFEDQTGARLPEDLINAGKDFFSVPFHPETKISGHQIIQNLRDPFTSSQRTFLSFPNTALYFPICYIPQAIGIGIGRLFDISALGLMYFGRVFNLLCWCGLVFTAIRVTPVFKWIFVLVGLMPMAVFLAASLSADSVINGCSLLFIASVLHERFTDNHKMSFKLKWAIGVMAVFLAMMKQVYAPLVGLLLIIPENRYGGWKKKILYCTAVAISSLLCLYLWGIEIKRIYVPLNGANMGEQLSFILAAPQEYAKILMRTIWIHWPGWMGSLIGILGWLDTILPEWIYLTYLPALAVTALLERREKGDIFCPMEKTAALGFACLSFLLIATAQYLSWNKPEALIIEGIQGRYLIPLLVPILLTLQTRAAPNIDRRILGGAVSAYSLSVLFVTCVEIYIRYYG